MRSAVSRPPNASDHYARPRQQHFLVSLSVFIALLDSGSLALKLRSRVLGGHHALKPTRVCDQVVKVLSETLEALPRVQHQTPLGRRAELAETLKQSTLGRLTTALAWCILPYGYRTEELSK